MIVDNKRSDSINESFTLSAYEQTISEGYKYNNHLQVEESSAQLDCSNFSYSHTKITVSSKVLSKVQLPADKNINF